MEMERINVREARRRRIIERGADRLALIKGQIDNTPPAPPPSPSGTPHAHRASADHLLPSRFSKDSHIFVDSDRQNNDTCDVDAYSSTSPEYHADSKRSKDQRCKQQIHSEINASATEIFEDDDRNIEPDAGTSMVQQAERQLPKKIDVVNMFSSKQINLCIIASKIARALCALFIALLAVYLMWTTVYLEGTL